MKTIYVSPNIAEALGINDAVDKPDLEEVVRLFRLAKNLQIKQALINATDDMPPEEKAVVLSSIETVFAPIDPNFNPTVAEVTEIEGDDGYFGACSDEFFN